MSTTILNVKIDPAVKTKAQKVAAQLGLSLSGLVNANLREIIRTKTLYLSAREEKPSARLLASVRAAEADIKADRVYKFESAGKAVEFLRRRRPARKHR